MPPTKTDEGMRLAGELRRTHPKIGVVILSQHAEPLCGTMLLEEARGDLRRVSGCSSLATPGSPRSVTRACHLAAPAAARHATEP